MAGRPSIEADKKQFLKALEDLGGSAGNTRLREKLTWGEDRYWNRHGSLIDDGSIERARGKGGSVKFYKEEKAITKKIKPKVTPEQKLYEPALKAIQHGWAKDQKYDSFVSEVIANPPYHLRGGIWTEPDIGLLGEKSYTYLPGRIFDLVSFEIKRADSINVKGLFEALSHNSFVTLSYVVFFTNGKTLEKAAPHEWKNIEASSRKYGIGLIVASKIDDYGCWEEVVHAKRNTPDPEKANLFIAKSFSEEARQRVIRWHK